MPDKSASTSEQGSHALDVLRRACILPPQVRKLGEGAFATVEECVLRGQHVAVKRLKPEMFADLMEVNDFVLEGVLIAQVHHPCGSARGRCQLPTYVRSLKP